MKKIGSHILLLLAVLLGTALWSCTDDIDYPRPNDEEFDGITLTIPNPALLTSTRASDLMDLSEGEGAIKELWLFAFDRDGVRYAKDITNLMADDTTNPHEGYEPKKKIQFKYEDFIKESETSADLKIYVTANISAYLPTGKSLSSITTESALRSLQLDFKEGEKGYRLNKEKVKEKGLPMICTHEEMKLNGIKPSSQNAYLKVEKGKAAVLHADLAFLCAKVRINVFFDNTASGYSHAVFGDVLMAFDGISFTNVYNGSTLTGHDSRTEALTLEGQTITRKVYPDASDYPDVSKYPDATNHKEDLTKDLDDWKSGNDNQRAWQSTIYLPSTKENITTVMTLGGHTENASGQQYGAGSLEYTVNLIPAASSGSTGNSTAKAIERAKAYDITARIYGPQTLKTEQVVVEDWTPAELSYVLQGPVYLHVDRTIVPVTAGYASPIWFETNVDLNSEFDIESPKYNDIDIYKKSFNATRDTLYISVNPKISTDWFEAITSDENISKYNFFHIKAKKLYKKIDVNPLNLFRFMTVTPKTFAVDVRELMASGKMNGEDYTFTVTTNLKILKIKKDTWNLTDDAVQILYKSGKNKDGETVINLNNETEITMLDEWDGVAEFIVRAKNINSNSSTYKKRSEQTFQIYADNTGQTGPNFIEPATLKVTVIPANDNYIIHFRGGTKNNNSWWEDMHIYAYQCLTIPKDFIKDTNGNEILVGDQPIAGRTVSDGGPDNAALQYLFSGSIAFRGWDEPINKAALDDYKNAEFNDHGFIKLTGSNWAPDNDVRYDMNYDFCKDYRNMTHMPYCEPCRDGATGSWKLVAMEPESNGWWKFELAGVAEPGKTFLMFNSGHTDVGIRFPGNNEVGVPLFDYPSREGWLDYSDVRNMKTFTSVDISKSDSQDIGGNTGNGDDTEVITVYFDNTRNWSETNGIFCYAYDGANNGAWPGAKMTWDNTNSCYKVEIPAKAKKIIFNNHTNGANQWEFSNPVNNTRYPGGTIIGGGGGTTDTDYTLVLYWPKIAIADKNCWKYHYSGVSVSSGQNESAGNSMWHGDGYCCYIKNVKDYSNGKIWFAGDDGWQSTDLLMKGNFKETTDYPSNLKTYIGDNWGTKTIVLEFINYLSAPSGKYRIFCRDIRSWGQIMCHSWNNSYNNGTPLMTELPGDSRWYYIDVPNDYSKVEFAKDNIYTDTTGGKAISDGYKRDNCYFFNNDGNSDIRPPFISGN